ncbi:hypothetical protein QBC35DRAFT_488624 [Podospora australis]|uniref:Arf-GAP domain-containing protein n=1 Tax=Podospora australis TaxID=1536484 RepID=A0AAN6X0D2_9PEZI|nr:hypothetical protein QBC35DRAFT_488624 [Podospora australis]
MSRRPPNPGAERAAQNQQTIKSLLKLEANKVCADCKRNKHPRWASWNLGVFVCIRCSGIHRGMGTHISRVKSVDLDSWTDEQLQSVLNWGNARANKYWEAKLAPGHVPSEAKIENFIRTKYELKRWVMEGPMPDPATLDADGDDDVPLSVVKEKANVERRESVRKGSAGQSAAPRQISAPPQADLIGGEITSTPPPRASTAGPAAMQVAPKSTPAPPKTTSTKDSLLGLDFLGTEPAAPPRPASTTGTPSAGGQSRPDLKQSILSLYATAPRPQPQAPPQQVSHGSSGSFSGMSSPTGMSQAQSSFGGLNDAFSNLSFASSTSPKPAPVDAFSSLSSFTSSSRPAAQTNNSASAFSGLSGGSFFDSKPAAPAAPAPSNHQSKSSFGGLGGLGGWGSVSTPASPPKPAPAASASAALGDLFDFSSPAPAQAAPAPKPAVASPPMSSTSVFNLSQPKPAPAPAPAATSSISNPLGSFGGSNLSGVDVWGGNAWASAEPSKPEPPKPAAPAVSNDFGWGSFASQPIVPSSSGGFAPAPKVAADEEFGGWTSSAAPTTTTSGSTTKPASGLGGDDLFSNVWQ